MTMRILIADDNELIRQGVRNILASGDNLDVCGEAQDGEETIQRASELLPDSHHRYPRAWTTVATLLGAGLIWLVVRLAPP